MRTVIDVEALGKRYRLGQIGRAQFFAEWKRKLLRQTEEDDAPGSFWALRDLNFQVQQGQVVAVIGSNGAGKSTLLKILSGITAPTRGRARMRGRVASLLEVGTGFHQELSGRDNIFLNGAILGMSRKEVASKFDEIVAFSGVETFLDTPVKRYSSGMRVRLAFAVAAHLEAEIMIIDEVLAVGDQAFQAKCMGKMSEVSRAGRTVLFVSHNAAAVENLCTRGVVLHRGKLEFDGTQTEALQYYANRHANVSGRVADRTDRTGSGELVITDVEFRDSGGRVTQSVPAGGGLEVWLQYERRGPGDFSQVCCEIMLRTQMGAAVFNHSNWFTGERFGPLPDRGAFICRLPQVLVPEGSYKMDFGLYPLYRRRVPLDGVQNAAELHVLNSDFFGGGKMPALADGPCLVPGDWRMHPL